MTEEIVQQFRKKTLHGEVLMTMTTMRDQHWIVKLMQLTKRIIRNCYGSKRFHVKPYDILPSGELPKDRGTVVRAFQVIGLAFTESIMYKKGNSKRNKSYILLFKRSASRVIHLELVPN